MSEVPYRREYRANLVFDRVSNWNAHGKLVTHYLNGLSPLFPEGERFFLDSVRNYRSKINDRWLKKCVDGFIGQEVMHGKMHDEYDKALHEAGLPSRFIERYTDFGLQLARNLNPKMQLALTCAAEHYTATMAKHLIDSNIVDKSEPSFRWLWRTHAVEEFEHRCVSFDVYEVFVKNHRTRVVAFFLATAVLFPAFAFNCVIMAAADKEFKLTLAEIRQFMAVVGGMWVKIAPELLEYLDRDFHPAFSKKPKKFDEIKTAVGF